MVYNSGENTQIIVNKQLEWWKQLSTDKKGLTSFQLTTRSHAMRLPASTFDETWALDPLS